MPDGGRRRTRVLIVDDSVVARRMVAAAIEADEDLSVAGIAQNGRIGLTRIASDRPDVVVLDLEMPEMDGFAMLSALREHDTTLPVVVFSHLSARGAAETLRALDAGATAFALKPGADERPADVVVRDDLLPVLKAVAARACPVALDAPGPVRARAGLRPSPSVAAVVIAVSTGGPNALMTMIPRIPADLPVPVLIVQHMPPLFTAMLAKRMDEHSPLTVVEAGDGDPVRPGHVYLAPGGRHLALSRDGSQVRTVLDDGPPQNSCRPSADVLFRSAATAYGAGVLAVVMTGMGSDGLHGTRAVVDAGGSAIVQDRASSVVGSMPGSVADAGLADAVVPLDGLADEIIRRCVPAGRSS